MLLVLFTGSLLVLAAGCAEAAFIIMGSLWATLYAAHLQVCAKPSGSLFEVAVKLNFCSN